MRYLLSCKVQPTYGYKKAGVTKHSDPFDDILIINTTPAEFVFSRMREDSVREQAMLTDKGWLEPDENQAWRVDRVLCIYSVIEITDELYEKYKDVLEDITV